MRRGLTLTVAILAATSYWVALVAAGDFGFRLGLGERPQIALGLAHTVSYRADPRLPAIPVLNPRPAPEAAADVRPSAAESARQAVPAGQAATAAGAATQPAPAPRPVPAARSTRPPQGQQKGEHTGDGQGDDRPRGDD